MQRHHNRNQKRFSSHNYKSPRCDSCFLSEARNNCGGRGSDLRFILDTFNALHTHRVTMRWDPRRIKSPARGFYCFFPSQKHNNWEKKFFLPNKIAVHFLNFFPEHSLQSYLFSTLWVLVRFASVDKARWIQPRFSQWQKRVHLCKSSVFLELQLKMLELWSVDLWHFLLCLANLVCPFRYFWAPLEIFFST